jgi:hypothetical protein
MHLTHPPPVPPSTLYTLFMRTIAGINIAYIRKIMLYRTVLSVEKALCFTILLRVHRILSFIAVSSEVTALSFFAFQTTTTKKTVILYTYKVTFFGSRIDTDWTVKTKYLYLQRCHLLSSIPCTKIKAKRIKSC